MFDLIVAIDSNNGIGYKQKLPWQSREELKIFKEKTNNNIIVVGSKTLVTLPILENRIVYCLTKCKDSLYYNSKNKYITIKSLDEINPSFIESGKKIFIAGGGQIYKLALSNPKYVNTIHLSIMKKQYKCDTFFDINLLENFVITEEYNFEEFTHLVLKRTKNGESQYLKLLSKIMSEGILRKGRNGYTRSLFTEHLKFDLREGFPLLTTKKMFLRGIIEEFLFFIRGQTNTNILSSKNVHIWEGNTSLDFIKKRGLNYPQGFMGPMYGYQWRNFGAPYQLDENNKTTNGVDQLLNVINLIKNDPSSRRILMTSYNPLQAEEGVLYPCHSIIIQFYVDECNLDMFCFNRSQDIFLGVPYNIASSSLLLLLVADLTNTKARFLNITMGDTHIYEEHFNQVKLQEKRIPYKFPILNISKLTSIGEIDMLTKDDFEICNYKSHSAIKGKMII